MPWQVSITQEPANNCPHCGLLKPAHFLVCRACSRDLKNAPGGWERLRDVWTAEGNAASGLPRGNRKLSELLDEHPAVQRARRAVLDFLKLHSSAL